MTSTDKRRKAGNTGDKEKKSEIVVFWIVRDSVCGDCGDELFKGRFLRLDGDRPLCLGCADFDHLVYLARWDAALTRRACRYSTLRAVVVRFSRTRKRYERLGILVEEHALARDAARARVVAEIESRLSGWQRTLG